MVPNKHFSRFIVCLLVSCTNRHEQAHTRLELGDLLVINTDSMPCFGAIAGSHKSDDGAGPYFFCAREWILKIYFVWIFRWSSLFLHLNGHCTVIFSVFNCFCVCVFQEGILCSNVNHVHCDDHVLTTVIYKQISTIFLVTMYFLTSRPVLFFRQLCILYTSISVFFQAISCIFLVQSASKSLIKFLICIQSGIRHWIWWCWRYGSN